MDYSMTDLLNAGVSWGTLHQLMPKLLELNMVVKTRTIGRATLYKLNEKHAIVKDIVHLYDTIIYQAAEEHLTQKVEAVVK